MSSNAAARTNVPPFAPMPLGMVVPLPPPPTTLLQNESSFSTISASSDQEERLRMIRDLQTSTLNGQRHEYHQSSGKSKHHSSSLQLLSSNRLLWTRSSSNSSTNQGNDNENCKSTTSSIGSGSRASESVSTSSSLNLSHLQHHHRHDDIRKANTTKKKPQLSSRPHGLGPATFALGSRIDDEFSATAHVASAATVETTDNDNKSALHNRFGAFRKQMSLRTIIGNQKTKNQCQFKDDENGNNENESHSSHAANAGDDEYPGSSLEVAIQQQQHNSKKLPQRSILMRRAQSERFLTTSNTAPKKTLPAPARPSLGSRMMSFSSLKQSSDSVGQVKNDENNQNYKGKSKMSKLAPHLENEKKHQKENEPAPRPSLGSRMLSLRSLKKAVPVPDDRRNESKHGAKRDTVCEKESVTSMIDYSITNQSCDRAAIVDAIATRLNNDEEEADPVSTSNTSSTENKKNRRPTLFGSRMLSFRSSKKDAMDSKETSHAQIIEKNQYSAGSESGRDGSNDAQSRVKVAQKSVNLFAGKATSLPIVEDSAASLSNHDDPTIQHIRRGVPGTRQSNEIHVEQLIRDNPMLLSAQSPPTSYGQIYNSSGGDGKEEHDDYDDIASDDELQWHSIIQNGSEEDEELIMLESCSSFDSFSVVDDYRGIENMSHRAPPEALIDRWSPISFNKHPARGSPIETITDRREYFPANETAPDAPKPPVRRSTESTVPDAPKPPVRRPTEGSIPDAPKPPVRRTTEGEPVALPFVTSAFPTIKEEVAKEEAKDSNHFPSLLGSDDSSYDEDGAMSSFLNGLLPSLIGYNSGSTSSDTLPTTPTSLNVRFQTGHSIKSCLKDSTPVDDDNPSLYNSGRAQKKAVGFDLIEIREYARTLGDSPSCSQGPPISLCWDYVDSQKYLVDEYERSKPDRKKSKRAFHLSPAKRHSMLVNEWNVTRAQIRAAREKQHQERAQQQLIQQQRIKRVQQEREKKASSSGQVTHVDNIISATKEKDSLRGAANCPKQQLIRKADVDRSDTSKPPGLPRRSASISITDDNNDGISTEAGNSSQLSSFQTIHSKNDYNWCENGMKPSPRLRQYDVPNPPCIIAPTPEKARQRMPVA